MDRWKTFVNNKVYVELRDRRKYSGVVLDVDDNFVLIKDKFCEEVMIRIDEIKFIQKEV